LNFEFANGNEGKRTKDERMNQMFYKLIGGKEK